MLWRDGLLSSCGVWAFYCGGLSCWARALGHLGFGSCSSGAPAHRLNSCGTHTWLLCGMWDLPRSGIEPVHWQADSLPLSHQGSIVHLYHVLWTSSLFSVMQHSCSMNIWFRGVLFFKKEKPVLRGNTAHIQFLTLLKTKHFYSIDFSQNTSGEETEQILCQKGSSQWRREIPSWVTLVLRSPNQREAPATWKIYSAFSSPQRPRSLWPNPNWKLLIPSITEPTHQPTYYSSASFGPSQEQPCEAAYQGSLSPLHNGNRGEVPRFKKPQRRAKRLWILSIFHWAIWNPAPFPHWESKHI